MRKLFAVLLLGMALAATLPSAPRGCTTIETDRRVEGNCVVAYYETCCSGHCFAWSEAIYCSGGGQATADFSRLHYVSKLDQRSVVCMNGLVTPADDEKFDCGGLRREALADERRPRRKKA